MRRYFSKRLVYILSLGLFVFYIGYSLPSVDRVRNKLVSEYFKHKEFLYNLKIAKRVRKTTATELSVKELLEDFGLEVESVYSSEAGVEVKMEVPWKRLPRIVREIERRFRVVSFSAVDNTGKGLFVVRMVLR